MVMANRGRNLRLAGLRRAVRKPEPITKLEGVHGGIIRFDTAIKKLQEAGGTLPSQQEMKQDLLDILPSDLRESLLWRAEQPDAYGAFREHVITKAAEVMDIRGKLMVNSLEPQDILAKTLSSLQAIDTSGLNPEIVEKLDEIMAFTGGQGARRPGPPAPPRAHPAQRPPRQGQPQGAGKTRCVMCGQIGHPGSRCPQGFVEMSKRPCFLCGKGGHVSSQCSERGKQQGNQRAIRSFEEDDAPFSFSC